MTAAADQKLEANFSTLALSIASSAAMSLGLGPNPSTGKTEKDLHMAQFNIDLLAMLQEKTKNNLSNDETQFLQTVLSDLRLRFVEATR